MKRRLAFVSALILALPAAGSAAQPPSERATAAGTPAWMIAWSPLRSIADNPRHIPRAPALPRLLLAPQPETGLLWTAGNPGALPFQVVRRRDELRFGGGFDDGAYRRPLDQNDVDVIQFSGLGWQPVGAGGAAIGQVVVDREQVGILPFADVLEPHPSNPFVVADSSISDMRRVRARFEGAFGWRFGDWGVGVAGGLDVRDHRGEQTPLPRTARVSNRAAGLGIVRRLPFAEVSLGAHVRWRGASENINVLARLSDAVVFQLEGYAEPTRREIKPPAFSLFRRLESDAWAWGLSAAGRLAGSRWTLATEWADRGEGHFSDLLASDPTEDRWEPDSWTLSGSVQRRLMAERLLITANARYATLDGDATRADLVGVIFRASENVFDGSIDIRYAPAGSPWTLATGLGLSHESRFRRDFLAEVFSDMEGSTLDLAFELARSFGSSTDLSLGYGASFYWATSSIPNPESMGPVYRQLIAPELSLYSTSSRPWKLAIAWRQRFTFGSALLLRVDRERASPHAVDEALLFAPRGDRTLWHLSLALVLTGS